MHPQRWVLLVAVAIGAIYAWLSGALVSVTTVGAAPPIAAAQAAAPRTDGLELATFAAGCFWCTEADFDKVPGVISTTSGYTGGTVTNPTYKQVSSGGTGHAEAVQVLFDPKKVTYEHLLDHFWKNVDPFTPNRQFCDFGSQYRPEIFYHSEVQRKAAEASKARVQSQFKERIVVAITPAGPFYTAEEYHQDYYKKNSAQYRFYRFGCRRDQRLEQIWDSSK